jgi:glycosyltransferase involved in cell wall biosynthesis
MWKKRCAALGVLKVVFDLSATQSSNESPVHGGGEYAKYVFFASLRFSENLVCYYDISKVLNSDLIDACQKHSIELVGGNGASDISALMERDDVGTFYSALPYEFQSVDLNGKRFVGTIHGLRGIECPTDKFEHIYRKNVLSKIKLSISKLLRNRKKIRSIAIDSYSKLINKDNFEIITDSLHSKYSMLSFYPKLKAEQIMVFRCPYLFDQKSIPNEYNKGDYFLLINGNRWVKNNYRALIALDQLYSERKITKNVVLLGVGDVNFSKYIVNKDKFTFKGYVSDKELNDYFMDSYAFIYPTLNEGYGYPPIKAMEYSVPVIASSSTSVVEVCKGAALYFNPKSINEIKTRILTLINEPTLYDELVSKGCKVVSKLRSTNDKQLDDIVKYIFKEDNFDA